MLMTLGAAARAAGKSKSTVARAIESGRLSAARDDKGNYSIDTAELFRCWPPRNGSDGGGNGTGERDATPAGTDATAVLQTKVDGLEAQIATLREMTEKMSSQVEDLKAQRDGWQRQAEQALRITDQRPPRRGLFGWLKAS